MSWGLGYLPRKSKATIRAEARQWRELNPKAALLSGAKERAKSRGLPFNISINDFEIPEVCPYLKTPMTVGTMYAPSLDRIDNNKGYVKGNVEIISRKANIMKSDANIEELLEFAYTILERN